ncbi:muscle-specific protein 20-like [Mercenaria mercenaria]|uniref:muscle-specific protein 20-like n=1 Tax=Mercenaria mercenaria TaxID=6596 RepID=UPI001E1D4A23|nr:muscle-specific protein 20-like [Mercenaria mercenaria]
MATRPHGYGLTSEVNRKINQKYCLELEQQARQWMEAVLQKPLIEGEDPNTPLGEEKFQRALKDGVLLCELINTLQPGSIKKVNRIQSGSFKQFKDMENIDNFLTAITKYGVSTADRFGTANLTDRNNGMAIVLNCIHAVGRAAQKNGYHGPTLGPRESQYNPRSFDEETLHAGQTLIGLQYGYTKGASQKGMSFGKTRSIND